MIYSAFLNSLGQRSVCYVSHRSFFESTESHGVSDSSRKQSREKSGLARISHNESAASSEMPMPPALHEKNRSRNASACLRPVFLMRLVSTGISDVSRRSLVRNAG